MNFDFDSAVVDFAHFDDFAHDDVLDFVVDAIDFVAELVTADAFEHELPEDGSHWLVGDYHLNLNLEARLESEI